MTWRPKKEILDEFIHTNSSAQERKLFLEVAIDVRNALLEINTHLEQIDDNINRFKLY